MKKILVVGYGSIGRRHVKNLLHYSNYEILILTKKKYNNKETRVKYYNSLTEVLKEEPEIGFITNETSFHIEVAIKLAKKNIHLFIEKPLSNSIKNVQKLQEIVNKNKLITQMGCNWRFHPCIKKIKKIIEKNEIGKIYSVQVESNSYLPDWHPYEDYRNGYAAKKELGGGILLTCIHELDFLYWYFGKVEEIFSITKKQSQLEVNTDDISIMVMKFKKNILGELHLDYFQRPDFKRCKIIGSKGTLYWDSSINIVKFYSNNKKKWINKIEIKKYEKNQMYIDEILYFLKSVKKKKKTINPLNDGIKTLEISLVAIKSSKLKKMLKIS